MRVGGIAVYFKNHINHVSILNWQNANFLDVRTGGIYNNHFFLESLSYVKELLH